MKSWWWQTRQWRSFDDQILDRLPDALREGQSVARRFPRFILIVGASATVERVSEGLKTATLFHYAGHTHAKKAFKAELELLPDLKREIGYPNVAMQGMQLGRLHRTSDCQAPMILVANADPASSLKK